MYDHLPNIYFIRYKLHEKKNHVYLGHYYTPKCKPTLRTWALKCIAEVRE